MARLDQQIDTSFNFQAALGDPNKDADKYSTILQDYHHFLWSKRLPNGELFQLEKLYTACYLRYMHNGEEMILSSDRAVATFSKWKRMKRIIDQIPRAQLDEFVVTTETIGAIVIWPSTRVDGKSTINGERGFNRKICDRLDLTIECIRLYYNNENSPLFDTFKRYSNFFELFKEFKGYVDFFLLQDFVSEDYRAVKVAPPFDNFQSSPVPATKAEYLDYMKHMMNLVKARNHRIKSYVENL